jgi:Superfamily II DNA and RNA helicases
VDARSLFVEFAMPFKKLGLSAPLCQAIAQRGFTTPTSIQAKAIPIIQQGHDLIAAAQTGTGKTSSFIWPIIDKLCAGKAGRKKRARALVIAPTRELALQVAESARQDTQFTELKNLGDGWRHGRASTKASLGGRG